MVVCRRYEEMRKDRRAAARYVRHGANTVCWDPGGFTRTLCWCGVAPQAPQPVFALEMINESIEWFINSIPHQMSSVVMVCSVVQMKFITSLKACNVISKVSLLCSCVVCACCPHGRPEPGYVM